jgi:hypothetical protein
MNAVLRALPRCAHRFDIQEVSMTDRIQHAVPRRPADAGSGMVLVLIGAIALALHLYREQPTPPWTRADTMSTEPMVHNQATAAKPSNDR